MGESCEPKNVNASTTALAPLVMILLVMGGIWTLVDWRMGAIERANLKISEKIDSVRQEEQAELKEHALGTHSKTSSIIATLEERFKEVETQFRMTGDSSRADRANIHARLDAADNRGALWIPRIVTLEAEVRLLLEDRTRRLSRETIP